MSKTLISTITVGAGGAASIDFDNIPQTYTDLQIVLSGRSSRADTNDEVIVRFNGSTTGYSYREFQGNGSSASAFGNTNNGFYRGAVPAANYTANVFSNNLINIPNYAGNANKYILQDTTAENNGTGTRMVLVSGQWANTAAVTRVTLTPEVASFVQYSSASLYGVNRLPSSGSGATPNVEYLVVAGGGGAGNAGAGAGGLLTGTGLSVASGTALTITVGAGGSKSSAGSNTGQTNGSDSSFNSISVTGGGRGQLQNSSVSSGGSGGGGYWSTGAGGAGVSGQGYAGGAGGGAPYPNDSSGAGGGAGGVGGSGTSSGNAGNGGTGITSSITGYALGYAGGGGANGRNSQGLAGYGGGGAGGSNNGTPGALGTGGGGGGGASYGEAGGSGVVIIRYPDTYANPTATTGNPVVNYANGYKIYTWTNSGSVTF